MDDQEKLQTEIPRSRDALASIQRHVRSGVQRILNAGRKILKFVSVGSLVALTGCGAMSKSTSLEDSMQTMRDLVAELGRNRAGLQDDGRVLNCGESEEINDAQSQSENANTEILGPDTETINIATRKAGGRWIVCSEGKKKGDVAPVSAPEELPVTVEEDRKKEPEVSTDSEKGVPKNLKDILVAHNRFREEHCAPPLTWSDEIAQVAQKWAEQLKNEGCKFYHNPNRRGYGENLASGKAGFYRNEHMVTLWYNEIYNYDFSDPSFKPGTGHFTQVVWRGSRELGCGTTYCNNNQLWVCNYGPPGNLLGAFGENVLPKNCKK